jgi:hypothetical protein
MLAFLLCCLSGCGGNKHLVVGDACLTCLNNPISGEAANYSRNEFDEKAKRISTTEQTEKPLPKKERLESPDPNHNQNTVDDNLEDIKSIYDRFFFVYDKYAKPPIGPEQVSFYYLGNSAKNRLNEFEYKKALNNFKEFYQAELSKEIPSSYTTKVHLLEYDFENKRFPYLIPVSRMETREGAAHMAINLNRKKIPEYLYCTETVAQSLLEQYPNRYISVSISGKFLPSTEEDIPVVKGRSVTRKLYTVNFELQNLHSNITNCEWN